MKSKVAVIALVIGAFSSFTAHATIVLFDADDASWTTAIAGLDATTAYDFGLDADHAVSALDGPLGAAGSGQVSALTASAVDMPGGGRGRLETRRPISSKSAQPTSNTNRLR